MLTMRNCWQTWQAGVKSENDEGSQAKDCPLGYLQKRAGRKLSVQVRHPGNEAWVCCVLNELSEK